MEIAVTSAKHLIHIIHDTLGYICLEIPQKYQIKIGTKFYGWA